MTALKKPVPFGKYYLLERINVGGMAEVFKAKTFGVEGFERLLAVKRILPNIAEDEEFITMFIDEAKIAVQLQHANIAQIFDLGKVEDSFFIALEHVSGKDLRDITAPCGAVSERPGRRCVFCSSKTTPRAGGSLRASSKRRVRTSSSRRTARRQSPPLRTSHTI